MNTGSVTLGSGVRGLITCGPAPAMLKVIVSGTLTLRFADRMAWRNEPAPLSLVFVTTIVTARSDSSCADKAMVTIAVRINWFRIGVFMLQIPSLLRQYSCW